MKIICLSLILYSFSTLASNKISSGRTTKNPIIKKRVFFSVLGMMEDEFQYLAIEKKEKLVVYGGWQDSRADMAFARRWENAEVLIYRGMAHRKEINIDALILIVCHELGHLYGGFPYKDQHNQTSPEGQADYFATKVCLKRALKRYSPENLDERVHRAILNVGLFLANNRDIDPPSQETPDEHQVLRTNMRHPSPQCRLDTYFAGLSHNPRPACWFKASI